MFGDDGNAQELGLTAGNTGGCLGMMEMSCILTDVGTTWVCTFIRTHQILL